MKTSAFIQGRIKKKSILLYKLPCITASNLQTKNWRILQDWYFGGKKNECEKYQIEMLKKLGYDLQKTSDRLDMRKLVLGKICQSNYFDWSENFDGVVKLEKTWYFNLKMICSEGGAQMRSVREVYHFIEAQLKYLMRHENIIFINILDGDFCSKQIQKIKTLFNYYPSDKLYVGDLKSFKDAVKNW